jgi:hypothetical protein
VNPVLAGILYRSSGDQQTSMNSSDKKISASNPSMHPQRSQQALARVAVGKGIKHSYILPNAKPASQATITIPNPLAVHPTPVQASLSALTNNFRNSLQELEGYTEENNQVTAVSTTYAGGYIPGSLRRDDSLVDLAMIPMLDYSEPVSTDEQAAQGLTFVDFPWQEPEEDDMALGVTREEA